MLLRGRCLVNSGRAAAVLGRGGPVQWTLANGGDEEERGWQGRLPGSTGHTGGAGFHTPRISYSVVFAPMPSHPVCHPYTRKDSGVPGH